ncbi:uncharacterized protein LOC116178215 [Photinus pyralis]|uniref:uncharacterized protein LOC116178215 n=1 Tax=Photinus pyralis TaxID=7054 RepID=UPI001267321B|nr:uncharacterized protein LOC116178215 [Photinus pyralis]
MAKLTVLLVFCCVHLSLEEANNTSRAKFRQSPLQKCAEENGIDGSNAHMVYNKVRHNPHYVANETEKCYITCILVAKNQLTPTGEANLATEIEKQRVQVEKLKTCNEIREEDINKAALKLQICINKLRQ